MDEIKFNIRSLSDTGRVRRKSNDLDSKHKEKAYEKHKRKKKKQVLSTGEDTKQNDNPDTEQDDNKANHVDVFI